MPRGPGFDSRRLHHFHSILLADLAPIVVRSARIVRQTNGVPRHARDKVGITHRHLNVRIPQSLPGSLQGDTSHYDVRREGALKDVPPDAPKPRSRARPPMRTFALILAKATATLRRK